MNLIERRSLLSVQKGGRARELYEEKQHFKVGAESTGPISSDRLLQVIEIAAKTGAQMVPQILPIATPALRFPLECFTKESQLLPLWLRLLMDLSVGIPAGRRLFFLLFKILSILIPFWVNSVFCNGEKIHVSQTDKVERSLLVTGFGYEHDDPWAANMDLFKQFTDVSRGVRRLGAAAVYMSHVALAIVEAHWEYCLKPWDMAAGVLLVEEAGGTVSCMGGGKFSVFDRSVLVSNGVLHSKLLERIGPATESLKDKGIDFSLWYKPENYHTEF